MSEATKEAYIYFDKKIRPLPKDENDQIDTMAPGFVDNDVDAFRHAYVSGVFTQEYSEQTANILGWLNEGTSILSPLGSTNMDLWNNSVGRKLGSKVKNREQLADLVRQALKSGELIISLSDPRKFTEAVPPLPSGEHSVIVLRKDTKGVNEHFYDFKTSQVLTRSEFVEGIHSGRYPGYGIRNVKGVDYPFSKKDDDPLNNLG
jgi:hypothetical protein